MSEVARAARQIAAGVLPQATGRASAEGVDDARRRLADLVAADDDDRTALAEASGAVLSVANRLP